MSVTGLKYLMHVEVIAVQDSLRVTGFSRKERAQKLQKSVIKESEVFWEKRVQNSLMKIKLRNHFRYSDVLGRKMSMRWMLKT